MKNNTIKNTIGKARINDNSLNKDLVRGLK